jgi:hypothetical protein
MDAEDIESQSPIRLDELEQGAEEGEDKDEDPENTSIPRTTANINDINALWAASPATQLIRDSQAQTWETFDQLYDDINAKALAAGFGVIKKGGCNYSAGYGGNTRYELLCERTGIPHRQGAGRRPNRTSRKCDCKWSAKAVYSVRQGSGWSFTVRYDEHNHAPETNPAAIPVHRRQFLKTAGVRESIRDMHLVPGQTAADIAKRINEETATTAISKKDVLNQIRKIKMADEGARPVGRTNKKRREYMLNRFCLFTTGFAVLLSPSIC